METGGITEIKPLNWTTNGFVYPTNSTERCTEPNCFTHHVAYEPTNHQIEVSTRKKLTKFLKYTT